MHALRFNTRISLNGTVECTEALSLDRIMGTIGTEYVFISLGNQGRTEDFKASELIHGETVMTEANARELLLAARGHEVFAKTLQLAG